MARGHRSHRRRFDRPVLNPGRPGGGPARWWRLAGAPGAALAVLTASVMTPWSLAAAATGSAGTTSPGAGSSSVAPTNPDDLRSLPPPVMEVETMATENGAPGVAVVDPTTKVTTFYADPHPDPAHWLQVVVLDRGTLALATDNSLAGNASFDCTTATQCSTQVNGALATLSGTDLVVAAVQPQAAGKSPGIANLAAALGDIGVGAPPAAWTAPGLWYGSFSAIGVPATPATPGRATVHYAANQMAPMGGAMTAYLVRDAAGHYLFSSPTHLTVRTTEAYANGENVVQVGDHELESGGTGGFQVVVVNRDDGEPTSSFFQIRGVDSATAADELTKMSTLLASANAPSANDVVIVTSVGDPACSAYDCTRANQPLNSFITKMAFALTPLGGTVGPIFSLLDYRGQVTGGKGSYTLIGWSHAGYGQGSATYHFGTGAEEQGNLAPQVGVLARSSTDYGYALETSEIPGSHPMPVVDVLDEAPGPWPRQGSTGPDAAVSWIGQQTGLGADPRAQYYSNLTIDWATKRQEVLRLTYPSGGGSAPTTCPTSDLPATASHAPASLGFSLDDFCWAQKELAQEMAWIPEVRHYFDLLAQPYADSNVTAYADLTRIAAKVTAGVQPDPTVKVNATIRSVLTGLLDLAEEIPVVGKAFSVIGSVYTTAMELSEINNGPAENEFPVTVAELGAELAQRLTAADKTITTTMADEVLADHDKMQTVADCTQARSCPSDTGEWQITPDDQHQAAEGLQLSLEQTMYGQLLSAKYKAWVTPTSSWLDPSHLTCNWSNFAGPQFTLPFRDAAHSAYLTRINAYDRYENWVLGAWNGKNGQNGDDPKFALPTAAVTDLLWRPVDAANPLAEGGGLGLDREQFFSRWFQPPAQLASTSQSGRPFEGCKQGSR